MKRKKFTIEDLTDKQLKARKYALKTAKGRSKVKLPIRKKKFTIK